MEEAVKNPEVGGVGLGLLERRNKPSLHHFIDGVWMDVKTLSVKRPFISSFTDTRETTLWSSIIIYIHSPFTAGVKCLIQRHS